MNNPLKYVDPTGHGIWDVFKAIGNFFKNIFSFGSQALNTSIKNGWYNSTANTSFTADKSDRFHFDYTDSGGLLDQIIGDDDSRLYFEDENGPLEFNLGYGEGGWDGMESFGSGTLDTLAEHNLVVGKQGGGIVAYADSTQGASVQKDHGWLRPEGHIKVVGRDDDDLVPTGGAIGSFIDDYIPAGHTFGTNHDAFVEYMRDDIGLPDILVNFPSMLPIYNYSFAQESLNSITEVINSTFDVNLDIPFEHSH